MSGPHGWPVGFVPQLWPDRASFPVPLRPRPTIKSIIEAVAAEHGTTYERIISPDRRREVVRVRQEAMWTVRNHGIWSLPAIGRAFAGRDHATVLHGVRAHEKRMGAA